MNSEEILKKAVIRFHETELDALPSNMYLSTIQNISPEFKTGIDSLINASRRKAIVRKIVQRTAVFFFGIFASLLILCVINEDVRAECLRFLKEIVGDMTYYSVPVSTTPAQEPEISGMELGYVPEGFELVSENKDSGGEMFSYQMKGKEVYLDFNYRKAEETNYGIYNTESEMEIILLKDGSIGEYYGGSGKDTISILVWKKGSYICYISLDPCSEELGKDEIIKIAANVRIIQ